MPQTLSASSHVPVSSGEQRPLLADVSVTPVITKSGWVVLLTAGLTCSGPRVDWIQPCRDLQRKPKRKMTDCISDDGRRTALSEPHLLSPGPPRRACPSCFSTFTARCHKSRPLRPSPWGKSLFRKRCFPLQSDTSSANQRGPWLRAQTLTFDLCEDRWMRTC